MSEIVERVARAICEAEKMNPDDALGGWVHWKEAAEAAIEAMHEPTDEMIKTGLSVYIEWLPDDASRSFASDEDTLVRDIYVAMATTAFSREYAF